MADPRVVKLARLLVYYSLELKKRDYLLLEAYDISMPLVREVFREAVKAGAYVDTNIFLSDFANIFYSEATKEQLEYISPYMKFKSENYNAFLLIYGQSNFKALTNIPPEKIQRVAQANREVNLKFMKRMSDRKDLRWCGTIHVALGNSFPEAGGENLSSVHIDMVCDMKKSGEIYADGELIYQQGRFLADRAFV